MTPSAIAIATELCNACGLCCNGAIFADVQLRPGDDEERLRLLGLQMKKKSDVPRALKFLQPCTAHDGCQCRIYPERPEYCREFECALLKNVIAGRIEKTRALRLIHIARDKLTAIKELLTELGDSDETLSHRVRFKRVSLRMKQSDLDQAKAAVFGELTLAVHELNVLLAQSFYPGQQSESGG